MRCEHLQSLPRHCQRRLGPLPFPRIIVIPCRAEPADRVWIEHGADAVAYSTQPIPVDLNVVHLIPIVVVQLLGIHLHLYHWTTFAPFRHLVQGITVNAVPLKRLGRPYDGGHGGHGGLMRVGNLRKVRWPVPPAFSWYIPFVVRLARERQMHAGCSWRQGN
ncbi:hypothetical protein B0H14DRAFT_2871523 [Mycena olivaceomarginata]|nr:hypothetical protein B0H14DRAFT_2883954 [Mycena olivaceomarginata]KAJ7808028.1 hypothetical protein B0H14DRAFT_2871523 [Mycena olivaceomarginata]